MQKTLIINNLEFAQTQQQLSGSFETFHLTRLAELLVSNERNVTQTFIDFELSGDSKRFSYPSLHLRIKTKLPVICQRCLSEMLIDLDLGFDYLICNVAMDTIDENDETDWLEINNEMNVHELIEDELLLAMAIAPMHKDNCTQTSMQSGEKLNPFAVLKGKIT